MTFFLCALLTQIGVHLLNVELSQLLTPDILKQQKFLYAKSVIKIWFQKLILVGKKIKSSTQFQKLLNLEDLDFFTWKIMELTQAFLKMQLNNQICFIRQLLWNKKKLLPIMDMLEHLQANLHRARDYPNTFFGGFR